MLEAIAALGWPVRIILVAKQIKWNEWKKEDGSLKSIIKTTSCFVGKHNNWNERERKRLNKWEIQTTKIKAIQWNLEIIRQHSFSFCKRWQIFGWGRWWSVWFGADIIYLFIYLFIYSMQATLFSFAIIKNLDG